MQTENKALNALITARDAAKEAVWFAQQRGDFDAALEYLEQVNNYAMAIRELIQVYKKKENYV